MSISNKNKADYFYAQREEDFYEKQVGSVNPIRRWFHLNRYNIINHIIHGHFTAGLKILDIGCGSCTWNRDNLEVFGVDLNKDLLGLAKAKLRLKYFLAQDVFEADLKDSTFNLVVAIEFLEHIKDYRRLIVLMHRILRDGGFAVVSVPLDTVYSLWRYLFFMQVILHGFIMGDAYYRKNCGHVNAFSIELLKKSFIDAGFNIDLAFDMRRFSIFLVAQKPDKEEKTIDAGDLTVIIPTLNESGNIGSLLKSINARYRNIRIIVSDDGSVDGTAGVVKELNFNNVIFFDRSRSAVHGLTASVVDAARLIETEYFVVMDADCQHPFARIEEILNYLRLGKLIVVCSRVRVVGHWPLLRKITSYGATFLAKMSLIMRGYHNFSYDVLTGFFGVRTSFWKKQLNLHGEGKSFVLKGYKVLFDFLKIIPEDTEVGEVYYEFLVRTRGSSKMTLSIYWEFLKSVFK
jgi:dolichol-phosphate mannosyltransferase